MSDCPNAVHALSLNDSRPLGSTRGLAPVGALLPPQAARTKERAGTVLRPLRFCARLALAEPHFFFAWLFGTVTVVVQIAALFIVFPQAQKTPN